VGSIQGQTERSGNRTRSETRRTLGEGGGGLLEGGQIQSISLRVSELFSVWNTIVPGWVRSWLKGMD
jgi:hypothetical protein